MAVNTPFRRWNSRRPSCRSCREATGAPSAGVESDSSEIIGLIETLIRKGNAYVSSGDVYFAVESFKNYGQLAKRELSDMEAGARVEVSEQKRHPMDFALWKAQKPGEPYWNAPFGPCRPGWHIECSAMSQKYLGESFDIHGGGKDLIFPHHENELAQSEAASGKTFANIWMHNGFVNIDNEKMSKSLGNFFTIRDILEKFDAEAVRFYLLTTHYRSPINFSDGHLAEAEKRLSYFYETLFKLKPYSAGEAAVGNDFVAGIEARFKTAMDDDFNTAMAIGEWSETFRYANEILSHNPSPPEKQNLLALSQQIQKQANILGILCSEPEVVLERIQKRRRKTRGIAVATIEVLVQERTAARAARNFKRSDEIRDQLKELGVAIQDAPGGTTWEFI